MSVETSNPAPKRRLRWLRPQFSLRTLMIGITLLCVGFAWFGMKWRQAQAQAAAVDFIENGLAGVVAYEWENDDRQILLFRPTDHNPATLSLLLARLGYDFFYPVTQVNLSCPIPTYAQKLEPEPEREMWRHLQNLPLCVSLTLDARLASAEELRALPMWKNLKHLSLTNGEVGDDILMAIGECQQLAYLDCNCARGKCTIDGYRSLLNLKMLENFDSDSLPEEGQVVFGQVGNFSSRRTGTHFEYSRNGVHSADNQSRPVNNVKESAGNSH